MNVAELKKKAAYTAVGREVHSGMKLGLGTGSTVAYALDALGEALHEGRIRDIVGIPTSQRTAERGDPLGAEGSRVVTLRRLGSREQQSMPYAELVYPIR